MLGDAVALAIDHHMQTRIEKVLVGRTAQPFRHHATPGIGLAGRDRRRLDDTGQLDFELDRAVLIKVPVKAVIIIADGREERDHQPPGAPHLERFAAELIVLPEDAVILLMQADRVFHDRRFAIIVGDGYVEIMDVPEAVAAELECVGELAQPVLAGVERALPEMVRGRVGVGHDHIGHAGPIDDRPFARAVANGYLIQHEALARRPADAERPVLPGDLPALDREPGAFFLHDIERLDVFPHGGDRGAVIIARYLRNRNNIGFVHQLDDLVLDQIDQRDHAFDRVGITIVLDIPAPKAHPADEPAALLDVAVEIAGRERINLNQFDIRIR